MLKRRSGKGRNPSELLAVEMMYLRDERLPPDADFEEDSAWWSMDRGDDTFRRGRPPVADMWQALGDGITAEWIQERPGSRPNCWWAYDAPEPRRRLGGVGQPGWPDLRYGRPHHWSWPVSIPSGSFEGGPPACDPSDPPTYESQAEFLRRHGLLAAGEAERLTAEDYEPERIRLPLHVRQSLQ